MVVVWQLGINRYSMYKFLGPSVCALVYLVGSDSGTGIGVAVAVTLLVIAIVCGTLYVLQRRRSNRCVPVRLRMVKIIIKEMDEK